VIIAALLHDICKASILFYGSDGRIHHRSTSIKGHGYRSVALLAREGLELTGEEWLAIRWHMGTKKAAPDMAHKVRHSKLCRLVYASDKLDAKRGH
jgi:3'-5' exoribonuclease